MDAGSKGQSIVQNTVILQIGLLGTALILFKAGSNMWHNGQPLFYPESLLLGFVLTLAGLGCAGLAIRKTQKRWVVWSILVMLIGTVLASAYSHSLGYTPATSTRPDTEMITKLSVEALKRGENPYVWDFSDMLRVYRARSYYITPLADGSYQDRLAYPALAPLLFYGADRVGITEITTVSLLFHLALLVLVFWGTPASLRPVILLPLFILDQFTNLTLGGNQDVIFSTLLVGVVIAWERPVIRAVLYGLAAAFRQQPWLVGPFLVVHIYQERRRWRPVIVFLAISIGVFTAINLPFALWDFSSWYKGVFEHTYAAFNVTGQGLSVITQVGLFEASRSFYGILQFAALAILFIVQWRHPRDVGTAFWIFPSVYFWLYYRGMLNYWIYWIPPLLVASARWLDRTSFDEIEIPRASWRKTAALLGGVAVVSLIGALLIGLPGPVVQITVLSPLQTNGQWVDGVSLSVTNRSGKTLTPRFSAQYDSGMQALPWAIVSGPDRLAPGETAVYDISAQHLQERRFPAESGGQIVFWDAGGNYALRTVVDVPGDTTFGQLDVIRNPAFRFWSQDSGVPQAWVLRRSPLSATNLRYEPVDGRDAVVAAVTEPVYIKLSQNVTLPDHFDLWVYPTVTSNGPLEESYGLELSDGIHKVWVLFSDSDQHGMISGQHGYVYMPSPLNTWTKHTIDPAQLYALFGWSLPPYVPRYRDGLLFSARQVELSLFGASSLRSEATWIFGPIEQSPPSGSKWVAESFESPDDYYIGLGDEYRRQRNYDKASDAYQRALTYDDENAVAYYGLAESLFWQGDWEAAIEAFRKSTVLGYGKTGLAYRGIGWAEYNLASYSTADDSFQKAIQTMSGQPNLYSVRDRADAYNGLAWTRLQQGDCTSALTYFSEAEALDPTVATNDGTAQCQPSLEDSPLEYVAASE